ncbi:hypothetical protein [Paenibacillus endoradicis]|uniref:hypothetical protein n=1 Tax=Paenibacillus endoradicis TaxID=2972487 RepID=UPI0021595DAE|nr:hypothetical protein [Paenibacillus endoradicis]MCR8656662.1 hypothetical protein [Paenibacillus endoradicis]
MASASIFGIIPILFMLVLGGLGIYCLILFIQLAQRGITALDIYINEKRNRNY